MKLSLKTTIIATEKLRDYILNPANPESKSKARFLEAMGYERQNWSVLESDLREQHLTIEVTPGRESIYGKKYEIFAPLVGPNSKSKWLRSIWMIRTGESFARLITLVPEKQP